MIGNGVNKPGVVIRALLRLATTFARASCAHHESVEDGLALGVQLPVEAEHEGLARRPILGHPQDQGARRSLPLVSGRVGVRGASVGVLVTLRVTGWAAFR